MISSKQLAALPNTISLLLKFSQNFIRMGSLTRIFAHLLKSSKYQQYDCFVELRIYYAVVRNPSKFQVLVKLSNPNCNILSNIFLFNSSCLYSPLLSSQARANAIIFPIEKYFMLLINRSIYSGLFVRNYKNRLPYLLNNEEYSLLIQPKQVSFLVGCSRCLRVNATNQYFQNTSFYFSQTAYAFLAGVSLNSLQAYDQIADVELLAYSTVFSASISDPLLISSCLENRKSVKASSSLVRTSMACCATFLICSFPSYSQVEFKHIWSMCVVNYLLLRQKFKNAQIF